MRIKRVLFTAVVLMAAVCLPAQNKCVGINLSAVNIGLLSTMDHMDGVGINVAGSVVHGEMNGVQITGLVTITGNKTRGVIISGLTGIGGDNTSGVMLGGLMNVTGNMASGLHLSGIANITGQSFGGGMVSGLLNVTGEHMNGLQLAGFANITASRLRGVQVALCNYATQVRGLQIGLVNYYREEMKGFQLGLVNANPETNVQMMLYGGNATPANIGVRFKNRLFYTILGVGSMYQGLNDKFSASVSYRVGLSVPLYKRWSVSGDVGYQHIEAFDNKDEVIPRRLYALQARVNLEYRFTGKFGIFATGGYGLTGFYHQASNYDKGAIMEAGIVLF